MVPRWAADKIRWEFEPELRRVRAPFFGWWSLVWLGQWFLRLLGWRISFGASDMILPCIGLLVPVQDTSLPDSWGSLRRSGQYHPKCSFGEVWH